MPDRDLTNVQFPMLNSYPNRGRRNPTSTSAENCALGIEHWSDPGSDAEQWILPSYFCTSPLAFTAPCTRSSPPRPCFRFLYKLQPVDMGTTGEYGRRP